MSWTQQYQIRINDISVPATPKTIMIIGYPVTAALSAALVAANDSNYGFIGDVITSENRATAIALSWARRYASLGQTVDARVYGTPQGADEPNPVQALPADAKLERNYGVFTITSRDLKHALSLASESTTGAAGQYGTAYGPDITGVTEENPAS